MKDVVRRQAGDTPNSLLILYADGVRLGFRDIHSMGHVRCDVYERDGGSKRRSSLFPLLRHGCMVTGSTRSGSVSVCNVKHWKLGSGVAGTVVGQGELLDVLQWLDGERV